jgi:hypothetical protein
MPRAITFDELALDAWLVLCVVDNIRLAALHIITAESNISGFTCCL